MWWVYLRVHIIMLLGMAQEKFRYRGQPYSLCFPRRVLIPWLASVFICDYLQPLDSFKELHGKRRCCEYGRNVLWPGLLYILVLFV
ncbi:phosphoglucomutase, chloroplastic-like [Iris pallida]|uniref:Phosphoglucomutase, chloroplastic-like n=1 Tax=Iris pallida TaxID=29817 RepID=A0AAX6DL86_IRIPA|nr:phosphoglucomutase, chloroplastic-like [Iris pallida]